jgi:carboxyl-terminal processing protease
VEYEMLENDIAYLALNTFSDSSVEEMRAGLKDLLAQKPDGLILDLRNNSGGYLVTAIDVASEFIDEGLITYEVYGDGSRDDYEASGEGIATKIPMVVLVNEWSASASELVAGAIQDYGRAPLVGVTTFGKGTVQNWIPLSNDEGAIRVTVARYFTPEGRNISGVGLTPDYTVEFTEQDMEEEKDPQLDKAIELLTQ